MKNSLFIILVCISVAAHGQKIDSLLQALPATAERSTARVDVLNQLGYAYWIVDARKSVAYGRQASGIAGKIGYAEGLAFSKRVEGVAHWALGEPKKALENLIESLNRYQQLEDREGVANCQLNIGMVYAEIDEDEKAIALFNKAIDGFTLLNLKSRIGTAYTKIGSIYLKNGAYEKALTYFKNSLEIHEENNFIYGMAEVHGRFAALYIKTGELGQVEYHIQRSVELGKAVKDNDGMINSLILYGTLLKHRKEFGLANDHLKLALNRARAKNLNSHELAAYKELIEVKKGMGQLDSALYYSELHAALKDSIFNTKKSKQIAAIEFGNQLQEKDIKLEFLAAQDKSNTKIKWILFIGIWVVSLLSVFLIKSLRQRNKNQLALLRHQEAFAQKEIEAEKEKQTQLQRELQLKNKELTSYAINFIQKNELLAELKEKITSVKETASDRTVKKQLSNLEKVIKQYANTDKDWEDFKFHFEQVHTEFFKNLKAEYPNLSSNDLKIAALTRLNLSVKESAGIMGISAESAKTARYRLRKKLDIAPDEELFDFLLQKDV